MVLVVEDEALVRMFIVDQLRISASTSSRPGSCGRRPAAPRATASNWDIAIIDRGLPDRDGLDLVAELRTRLASLPVIVASGYGDLPDNDSLRNDPHIRFMSKPYDIDGLTSALRALHVRTKEMG